MNPNQPATSLSGGNTFGLSAQDFQSRLANIKNAPPVANTAVQGMTPEQSIAAAKAGTLYQAPNQDTQPHGILSGLGHAITSIPGDIKQNWEDLVAARNVEGNPTDVPAQDQTGSDSANSSKSQINADQQETNQIKDTAARENTAKDLGAVKDITGMMAAAPGHIIGGVLGLTPWIDPATGKLTTLNKLYSSPEMAGKLQDLENAWGQLTKNHPVAGQAIANIAGIGNNALQMYAGGETGGAVTDFAKGALDSSASTTPNDNTPPGGSGSDNKTPQSSAYQRGQSFGNALRNGKLSDLNPLTALKNKLVPASTQSQFAAANLPDAEDVIKEASQATRARLNDTSNPGALKTVMDSAGKQAQESLTKQLTDAGTEKDTALATSADSPVKGVKDIEDKFLDDVKKPIGKNDNAPLEQFQNELHELVTGNKNIDGGRMGNIPIKAPEGYTPTMKDIDAFVDRWQSQGLKDGQGNHIINSATQGLNELAKTTSDGVEGKLPEGSPSYRGANEKFAKLLQAQSKLRDVMGNVDRTTGLHEGSAALGDAMFNKDQPLAGVQKLTDVPLSQKASIAKMFDVVGDGGGKTGALNTMRISFSPELAIMRTLQGLAEKYFATPEALESKLLSLTKSGK